MSLPPAAALESFIALLETPPADLLPLSRAEEWARELGLRHRLLCSVTLEGRGVVCALTTADPAPVLEALLPDGRRRALRSRRQIGAETWEYAAPLEWPAEAYWLELRWAGETRLLPLAPALLVLLEAHGWGDPLGKVAEGCVRLSELGAAVAALLAGRGAVTGRVETGGSLDAPRMVRLEAARVLREEVLPRA